MHARSSLSQLQAWSYRSAISPHVIRQACHLLSHHIRYHSPVFLPRLGCLISPPVITRGHLLFSLTSTILSICNKASCLCRQSAGPTAHTCLTILFIFSYFRSWSLGPDGYIYPWLQHTARLIFIATHLYLYSSFQACHLLLLKNCATFTELPQVINCVMPYNQCSSASSRCRHLCRELRQHMRYASCTG